MSKELELWQFVAERLLRSENVMLLVVAESTGSSPGRQGYKMAVGADGQLCGSIGGGVMEVNLVEHSRVIMAEALQKPARSKGDMFYARLTEQVHRKGAANSSGMICSGKQTVIFRLLTPDNTETIGAMIDLLRKRTPSFLKIMPDAFNAGTTKVESPNSHFEKLSDTEFEYTETLGFKNDLYIIGGGHCALALSELMSKMNFHISIFDDRPDLNTIEKNRYAHEIHIIDSYKNIGTAVRSGENIYVVVMTLGYKSDGIVMRQLLGKDFKYFGVLSSKAKMATLMNELKKEGFPAERLERIHTPIGIPINSRTPEEIAVSIAAEMIKVKNWL